MKVGTGVQSGLPGEKKPCYLVAQALSLEGARFSNVTAALSQSFKAGPFS